MSYEKNVRLYTTIHKKNVRFDSTRCSSTNARVPTYADKETHHKKKTRQRDSVKLNSCRNSRSRLDLAAIRFFRSRFHPLAGFGPTAGRKFVSSVYVARPSISIIHNPDTVFLNPLFRITRAAASRIPLYASSFSTSVAKRLCLAFSWFLFFLSLSLSLFLFFSSFLSFPSSLYAFFLFSMLVHASRERDKGRAFIGRHYERDSPLSK